MKLRIHNLTFQMIQARLTTGPAATQSSSYSQFAGPLTNDYQFAFGIAGGHLGWRRSNFNNFSSGRVVDSLLVGSQVKFFPLADWQIGINPPIAPVSPFY